MSTRKTKLIAIIASIYALGALLIVSFVIYRVHTQGTQVEVSVQTIANSNAKIKAYKDLWVQFEATKEERSALSEFVLTEDEAGTFLTEIERIGTSQGVSITTSSLKVEKVADSADELRMQFILEGSESGVKKMITMLETLPYRSSLTSLTFTTQENGKVRSTVDLSIALVAYDK